MSERSTYALGALPKGRNPGTHHVEGWVDVMEKIKISLAAADIRIFFDRDGLVAIPG